MKKTYIFFLLTVLFAGSIYAEYPPPEKKGITLLELKKHLSDYNGKVVEITANGFLDLRSKEKDKYSVSFRYYNSLSDNWNLLGSIQVDFVGKDGLKFFKDSRSRGCWMNILRAKRLCQASSVTILTGRR